MRINICLASDNNYSKYLAVTMASILKNANIDDELFFYILDGGIEEDSKAKIFELNEIKKCNISFVNPNTSNLEDFALQTNYISVATYYRLQIASLLPKDVDKVIYLDCDILVLKSLKDLFLENIDNYFAGACEDVWEYNLHNMFFINAGVLLINLKLWRQEQIEQKLIDYAIKNKVNDQIVINYVLTGKIKPLDLKYNLQNSAYLYVYTHRLKYANESALLKSLDNVYIIHYIGQLKPWKSITFLGDRYLKYTNLVPFKDVISFKNKIKFFFGPLWMIRKNIKYQTKYFIKKTFNRLFRSK